MIFLSSFVRARLYAERGVPIYSVARWRPAWTHAQEWSDLPFLAAADRSGAPIRLRDHAAPISGYCATYGAALAVRWAEVGPWLASLDHGAHAVLACWCPYSSAGRRQIAAFGTFFCHTVLIGELIRAARPDVPVRPDKDRRERGWACAEPWWRADLAALVGGGVNTRGAYASERA